MQCMKRAEEVLDKTRGHISTLRDEEQAQYNATEAMIADFQAQQATRSRQTMAHRASDLAGGHSLQPSLYIILRKQMSCLLSPGLLRNSPHPTRPMLLGAHGAPAGDLQCAAGMQGTCCERPTA